MKALIDNDTWDVVDLRTLPAGHKVLSGSWVYVEKEKDGQIVHKARWVVRGFEQRDEDIDWDELHAATVKAQTTRILFALAAEGWWDFPQMDAVAAFLNGNVDGEVYVEMPTGYREKGKICKLKKDLYGLKQLPAIWYGVQARFLKELGYEQSIEDLALFFLRTPRGMAFISSHFDDYLITASDAQGIQELKAALSSRFKMKDIGACTGYLGMQINRNEKDRSSTLTQSLFTTLLLKEAGMWDVKAKTTPMEVGVELAPAVDEKGIVRQEAYRKIVGKVQWLAVVTRPDITHTVSKLASVANASTDKAWTAVKRLLRYLRGTIDFSLRFCGSSPLTGYSDANWASGPDARAATGIIFMMNGGPIHWYSRRQSIVALSTYKAEFIAAATATQDAAWIGPHVRELQEVEKPIEIPILIDNQGAIALAKKDGWN